MVDFVTPLTATRLYCGRVSKLMSGNFYAATHETKPEDHDFCWSHYTDTNPTSRDRALYQLSWDGNGQGIGRSPVELSFKFMR